MACSTRPGPARMLKFVEDTCGVKVSQAEWHALKTLAQREEDGTGSRARASADEVHATVRGLAEAVASEQGYDRDYDLGDFHGDWTGMSDEDYEWVEAAGHKDFYDAVNALDKDIKKAPVTKSTLEALDYMAAWGPEQALERARAEIKAKKDAEPRPIDLDRVAALDALDRKVNRERKRLGLPPVA